MMTGIAAAGFASALPRLARADIAALHEAARKEATVTWYIAQVDTETAEAMGRAFTAKYPGVTVASIRTTGQVAYERLLQDLKNHAPQCDVFSGDRHRAISGTGNATSLPTTRRPARPRCCRRSEPVEDPGYWYPAASNTHLLVHHAQKVSAAEAPKNWPDLLDPKWKGRVATGHPAFSGCTGIWVLALRKKYGWEFFEKLAKNNPRIGRSGNDPVTLINAGECLVGPAPANTAFQQVDKGNPIVPVYPIDGATLCVGPSAVMASAPHPNAARLFMEWLMSDDFSKLSVANHGDPVHPGLTLTSGQKPLDQVTVMALSVDEIAKGVPEVIEQWRDTFGS